MEATIRRAEARDVPAMLELVRELAVFEREPEAVTVTEEHMRDAGFGPDPVWVGWVAETLATPGHPGEGQDRSDNTVVGMAVCYERYSTWRGRTLYLEDIIVTGSVRGQGIGGRLFKACAAYAVERGHHHMVWQVLDWNKDAIRFYERSGAELTSDWLNGRLYHDQLKRIASE